jgi:hypothetical protein
MNNQTMAMVSCPSCLYGLSHWPDGDMIKSCDHCLRPLIIHPSIKHNFKVYQIKSVFSVLKQITGFMSLLVIVAIGFKLVGLNSLVFFVAITFFINGWVDLADGAMTLKTGLHNSWLTKIKGISARTSGIAKVMIGILMIALSFLGLSISSHMG